MLFDFFGRFPTSSEMFVSLFNEYLASQAGLFNPSFVPFNGSFYNCKKRIDLFIEIQKTSSRFLDLVFKSENQSAVLTVEKVKCFRAFDFRIYGPF